MVTGEALTPLLFEYINGNTWKLVEDFTWRFRDGVTVSVPSGFTSDKHSVPRVLWSLIPPDHYGRAAIFHDWAYYRTGILRVYAYDENGLRVINLTRKECDLYYCEMLDDLGASCVLRKTMYVGVRVGGWNAWRKHLKANAKGLRQV